MGKQGEEMMYHCATLGCEKPATLRCPSCVKLSLPEEISHFCSQECFKGSWKIHKLYHAQPQSKGSGRTLDSREKQRLAFQHFQYTGKLRVGYVSPMRSVPDNIQRPDYSFDGIPTSEEKSKRYP